MAAVLRSSLPAPGLAMCMAERKQRKTCPDSATLPATQPRNITTAEALIIQSKMQHVTDDAFGGINVYQHDQDESRKIAAHAFARLHVCKDSAKQLFRDLDVHTVRLACRKAIANIQRCAPMRARLRYDHGQRASDLMFNWTMSGSVSLVDRASDALRSNVVLPYFSDGLQQVLGTRHARAAAVYQSCPLDSDAARLVAEFAAPLAVLVLRVESLLYAVAGDHDGVGTKSLFLLVTEDRRPIDLIDGLRRTNEEEAGPRPPRVGRLRYDRVETLAIDRLASEQPIRRLDPRTPIGRQIGYLEHDDVFYLQRGSLVRFCTRQIANADVKSQE